MSWVRNPLAAPILLLHLSILIAVSSRELGFPIVPRVPKPVPSPVTPVASAPEHLFAGTSGWAYPTWKPGFYPANVPQKKFLEFYASQLNSVEVNYTFRALPTAKMLEGWLAATPAHFRFSFKAPQRITHFKRLVDCEADVAQFLEALAPIRAANRLGLLLFQLPPNFKADPSRLSAFLDQAAFRATVSALAFEFRNASFFSDETYSVLRDYNASLCIADTDDLTTPEVHTAVTHTCFRLRREGGYSAAEVAAFAERFKLLAQARDTYVYFRHEDEPTGALNAAAFLAAVGAGA
ncbi:MAG: hypothetical protein JWM43_286 [Acidobacteriaceae bacterium]|nr:hypothetical protein [Acidobacteriaceae bacterium]